MATNHRRVTGGDVPKDDVTQKSTQELLQELVKLRKLAERAEKTHQGRTHSRRGLRRKARR
jgi:hypothetical protein